MQLDAVKWNLMKVFEIWQTRSDSYCSDKMREEGFSLGFVRGALPQRREDNADDTPHFTYQPTYQLSPSRSGEGRSVC